MTDQERQIRYRKGKTWKARKASPEYRAAQAARVARWRASKKGKAWAAKYAARRKAGRA